MNILGLFCYLAFLAGFVWLTRRIHSLLDDEFSDWDEPLEGWVLSVLLAFGVMVIAFLVLFIGCVIAFPELFA